MGKEIKELKDKFSRKSVNGWNVEDKNEVFEFAKGYKDFLKECKIEREVVDYVKKRFNPTSDEFILINRKKSVALVKLGEQYGMKLIASHIDAPRIDVKQNPLFEDTEIALFHTHYYGGIKKYQWLNIPIALHGVIVKSDGKTINVVVGEKDDDPVFVIPDLLPHISKKIIDEKLVKEAFDGDKLNLIIGGIPLGDYDEKELIKLGVLKILYEKYGIIEEDLISAELELVPAFEPRDLGFDRSFIAGYGQDDRICAYSSLEAFFHVKSPKQTIVVLMVDKEEIGSEGNTSAQSKFIYDIVVEILKRKNIPSNYENMGKFLSSSYALSADVNGAVNPMYKEVHEKDNASYVNYGIVLAKFTGSGGKYSASDASAEYVGKIRKIFNKNAVVWQIGELGKVDEGGGGTIAKYLANLNIDVVDCGPALISMHSTYEISSKVDLFESFKAYSVFFSSDF